MAPGEKGKGVAAEPREAALKGWAVTTRQPINKGELVGKVPPLLVHQTLANRDEVLVCSNCHRFLGTAATQLAMIDGLRERCAVEGPCLRRNRKRTRSGSIGICRDEVALEDLRSPRIEVVLAPPSELPDLPTLTASAEANGADRGEQTFPHGSPRSRLPRDSTPSTSERIDFTQSEGSNATEWSDDPSGGRCHDRSVRGMPAVASGENGSRGRGDYEYRACRCEGGLPCDDVFCSEECRAEAMAGGHRLICPGGSEEGRPIYEFREFAKRTSETYLIAASGVAAALSKPDGTRTFEALAGWNDPLHLGDGASDEAARAGVAPETPRTRETGQILRGSGPREASEWKKIELSMQEAEEAWFMMRAAIFEGGGHGEMGGNDAERGVLSTGEPTRGKQSELRDRITLTRDGYALTLDFFLRLLRALERHLAAVTVNSPLVGYCGQLAQASAEVKARALPWLSAAIGRASRGAAANAPRVARPARASFPSRQAGDRSSATAAAVPADSRTGENMRFGCSVAAARRLGDDSWRDGNGCIARAGQALGAELRSEDGDEEVLLNERAICRLVRGGSAGQSDGRSLLFPPLSVVGLLPATCYPDHSCVPNVQLEASLLPIEGQREDGGTDAVSAAIAGKEVVAPGSAGGGGKEKPAVARESTTALRVGLVSLRRIPAAGELFAPYVALTQHVGERRQELSRLFGGPSGRYLCICPRCRLEGDGNEACDPDMLKALADQALEEGRHEAAMQLYTASLEGLGISASSPWAVGSSATTGPSLGDAEGLAGDCLHGIGVALLGNGRYREACVAWERGLRVVPSHKGLRAHQEKDAAYRPKDACTGGLVSSGYACAKSRLENRGCSAGRLDGYHDMASFESFASIPGGPANIFLGRRPILSPEECRDVIRVAAEHAEANGGWTTSRHYAVPTTDLPLHVLLPLLPWFRALLSERLFPLLERQFKLRGGAHEVFVHDAFVVRYEEGKQRYLPLHRDQSTHSFTIALNGLDEYRGGGTFFPCLNRALRPPMGHALSFSGNILHGGDPITRGIRYIIACFCYSQGASPSGEMTSGGDGSGTCRLRDGLGRDRRGSEEAVQNGECGKEEALRGGFRATGQGEVVPRDGSGGGVRGCGAAKKGIEFDADKTFSFGFS